MLKITRAESRPAVSTGHDCQGLPSLSCHGLPKVSLLNDPPLAGARLARFAVGLLLAFAALLASPPAQAQTPLAPANQVELDDLLVGKRLLIDIPADAYWTITTIAGTGEFGFSGDGGPAVEAELRNLYGVAVDSAGNLYIADSRDHRIRKVDLTGTITTIAGTGEFGFGGDGGPAAAARLDFPYGVAVDSAGNLYIADAGNRRIRKIDSTGTITTIAGTGEFGFSGDGGPAVEAEIRSPRGVAVDSAGNLYIADAGNRRIRKIDSTGTITTIAGTGEFGFSGDGGPAAAARLDFPYGVAVDSAGNLYIADAGNRRIRKIDSTGTITTIAGTGEFGFSGDGGPAVEAEIRSPRGVAVDSAGNVYIADSRDHRIRKVDSTGTITTIAGTGEFGFSGDGGPAAVARLAFPYGVAVDSAGNLYIADTLNRRIRKLTPGGGSTPPNPTAVLNAASFTPGAAPGSLQSLFGERLALETAAASELPLPEALGGVRIEIIDSTEAAHAVQLLYVSPGQINFLTPSGATPGAAVLRLTREGEEPVESALTISVAAPGLFSANGTGEGASGRSRRFGWPLTARAPPRLCSASRRAAGGWLACRSTLATKATACSWRCSGQGYEGPGELQGCRQ